MYVHTEQQILGSIIRSNNQQHALHTSRLWPGILSLENERNFGDFFFFNYELWERRLFFCPECVLD